MSTRWSLTRAVAFWIALGMIRIANARGREHATELHALVEPAGQPVLVGLELDGARLGPAICEPSCASRLSAIAGASVGGGPV